MKLGQLAVPGELWERILQHAESEYPAECCGIALAGRVQPDQIVELIPCRNAQDEFHERDPRRFPRTSANGYFIDPKELLRIERHCREWNRFIRLIYHSHPDAEAYFSTEDEGQATFDGDPSMPDSSHLVLSVRGATADKWKVFHWHGTDGYLCVDAGRR